jgi:hypothetical protein
MTPLMYAPQVIPQLILNLCTISIATCNKFFDQERKTHKMLPTEDEKNASKVLIGFKNCFPLEGPMSYNFFHNSRIFIS